MNILHLKYAVEVANQGSLNKAAEVLRTAQPNVSRSVKELEADIGIKLFSRSAKGMVLTAEGEEFIGYAKEILSKIDSVEKLYRGGSPRKQKFSVSVPGASYISEAFARFSNRITADPAEIFYTETNSSDTVNNILHNDYKLGIVRYAEKHDRYFKEMLEEKGIAYELLSEFSYNLVMSRKNPLALKESITVDDLAPFIELEYSDAYAPSFSQPKGMKDEIPDNAQRRIFVLERASRLDILSENPETFTWGAPMTDKTLSRYGLTQKPCENGGGLYRDVLIYRENYKLTKLDNLFITELINVRRKCV